MTIVAGSYERFLFGYELTFKKPPNEDARLIRSFTYPAHQGPVKCIVAGGPYVVSGGADDQLHIYDIQEGKDLGFLMNPGDGSVTAVAMYTPQTEALPTHLFSGSEDGGVCIWQAGGSWDCMKVMKGHRKEVSSLSIHPSGKLALSTSRDSSIRLWNLVKGKSPWFSHLQQPAELVAFNASGSHYALVTGTKLSIHSATEEGKLTCSLSHDRKLTCAAFSGEHTVLAGAEDGSLQLWDTRAASAAILLRRAHSTRLRGLALPQGLDDGASNEVPGIVSTAASDGTLKLWDLRAAGSGEPAAAGAAPQALQEASTSARLTCLCAADPPELLARKLSSAKASARQKEVKVQQEQPSGKPEKRAKTQLVMATRPPPELLGEDDGVVVANGIVEFKEPTGNKKRKKGKNRG